MRLIEFKNANLMIFSCRFFNLIKSLIIDFKKILFSCFITLNL